MKIFIGWDPREDIAYQVCKESLIKNSDIDMEIQPIKMSEMREKNLYWREADPLSSTEFTFTRFLTPLLSGYEGWSIFMDCDFMWRGDISTVIDYLDPNKAVMVVKHHYIPSEKTKMDGSVQHQYPRKNWSSFMVFNCSHPDTQSLTAEVINRESGAYLHQFRWTKTDNIGGLPIFYNYLEGWNNKQECPNPLAVHFTRGGPWFRDYLHVEYGDEWMQLARELETKNGRI
ncbi:MAG: glycosyltransferase [Burkholderiales bacterium]